MFTLINGAKLILVIFYSKFMVKLKQILSNQKLFFKHLKLSKASKLIQSGASWSCGLAKAWCPRDTVQILEGEKILKTLDKVPYFSYF